MLAAIIVFMVLSGVVSVCALGILIFDIISERRRKPAESEETAVPYKATAEKSVDSKTGSGQQGKRG